MKQGLQHLQKLSYKLLQNHLTDIFTPSEIAFLLFLGGKPANYVEIDPQATRYW